MTVPERDELVAQALADLPVPGHRPGFWDDLSRDVAAEAALLHDLRQADDDVVRKDARLSTSELPMVRPISHARRSRRTPWLAVAAGLLVLAGAVGFTLAGGGGNDDDGEFAGGADGSTTVTEATDVTAATLDSSTTAATGGTPTSTTLLAEDPIETVQTFLQALATGDNTTAASLLGPGSLAYISNLGGTAEGMMAESQEGFGAWPAAPDIVIESFALDGIGTLPSGADSAFVVVSGTYTGEGSTGFRADVFPVVEVEGSWRVEHVAWSPERANELVFTLPTAQDDGNLGGMNPDDDVNVFVPTTGTVVFQIDGGELASKTTSIVAGDPFALYNPPADLSSGTHRLVVLAYGDDGTITHFAGTFVVEG